MMMIPRDDVTTVNVVHCVPRSPEAYSLAMACALNVTHTCTPQLFREYYPEPSNMALYVEKLCQNKTGEIFVSVQII